MADDARTPFEQFYARYHRRLLGFAIRAYGRADADDLAQDAMVRAYASYARLDPGRDPWPWLVAIVRNVARDRYARPAAVPFADVPVGADDGPADVEERAMVRAALGRLSSGDRTVLVLREWHDLSFGELSGLLGRSPNTLRQQVLRARRRLADAYTSLGGRVPGLLAWVRWRGPVAGQVAAAVVAGVVVTTPPATPPRPAPAAVVPVERRDPGVVTAARRAAPERPLLPSRAARSGADPAGRVARSPAPARRGETRPPPRTARRPGIRVTAGDAGHEQSAAGDGTAVTCAAAALCAGAQIGRGTQTSV